MIYKLIKYFKYPINLKIKFQEQGIYQLNYNKYNGVLTIINQKKTYTFLEYSSPY